MKKIRFIIAPLLFIFFYLPQSFSQPVSVQLLVFEPLPEIDFAAFAFTNNLKGAPRVLSIQIFPAQQEVILQGKVDWKRKEGEDFRELFIFTTEKFLSRVIYNDDLGNAIKITSSSTNSDLTDENIKKGKPTGSYRLLVNVLDVNGNFLASDVKELSFLNPAQTLSIRTPQAGSSYDVGTVVAEWDDILGAGSYKLRANIRSNRSQSFEEALKSGNPIINDKDVGRATSVNLRNYLDREWLPGQEIVLQVSASIPGPGGGKQLHSNIINFYLTSFDAPQAKTVSNTLVDLIQLTPDIPTSELVNRLLSGEMGQPTQITVDGSVVSYNELLNLLNYLKAHPESIISIKSDNK